MTEKQKHRYFDFIVYEESAGEGWVETLRGTHLAFAISPLHEPDGEHDKPHWHVMLKAPNPCTLAYAKTLVPAGVAANGYIEPTRAPRNYQRYLIHLDDPEKQQFDDGANAITAINGFPLDLSRDYSKAELAAFRDRIFETIRKFELVEYADLLDMLFDTGEVDLLDYASNHTILFNTYITSRREKYRWTDES